MAGNQAGTLFEEIRALAATGDPGAQFSLAMMLDHGQEVPRDSERALFWLRRAAEQDLAAACYYLGIKYEYGGAVQPDRQQAARWYRCAAVQDMPMAQFHLGILYLSRDSAISDPVKGFAWLSLAADHGYPGAEAANRLAASLLSPEQQEAAARLIQELRRRIGTGAD